MNRTNSIISELKRFNRINIEDAQYLAEKLVIAEESLEVERLRLAACGVAALSNTKESAAHNRIGESNPYYSASYSDVCSIVDSEMNLREENARLREALEYYAKTAANAAAYAAANAAAYAYDTSQDEQQAQIEIMKRYAREAFKGGE
jgi:hypothetical protein